MNKMQVEKAEQNINSTFGFNPAQYNRFIVSPRYLEMIQLAHENNWATLEVKMSDNDYFMS